MTKPTAGGSAKFKHAAPGPYLGFGLQTVRLTYHLLTGRADSTVSVEHDDDVSVHYNDRSILLEQTKSALSSRPLSDTSVDLWKTFSNWASAYPAPQDREGGVSYQLYVTPPQPDALATQMSAATSHQDIAAILERIAQLRTSDETPADWEKHLRAFLEHSSSTQAYIICRFKLINADHDPVDPIRQCLAPFLRKEVLDHACKLLMGHAKIETDQLLRQKQIGAMTVSAFRQYLQNFLSRLASPALAPLTPVPDATEIEEQLKAKPIFVRQMSLIHAAQDQMIAAVSDYLQAEADKTQWSDAGKIFPETLRQWDADLRRLQHGVQRQLQLTQPGLTPESLGMLVYLQSCQIQASLGEHGVTAGFIHGSLHDLANALAVGWHPQYTTLI